MSKVYFTEDNMCTTKKLEVKRIHDYFIANGWTIAPEMNQADIIICPTCVGWKIKEQKSLECLRIANSLQKKVVSFGCLNNFNPSGVAAVHDGLCIPAQNLEQVASLIEEPKVKFHEIPEPSTFKSKEDYRLYDLTKRYVNIVDGCSFACIYCPHRIGLGRIKSRKQQEILAQIKDLVSGGVRIVVLTGMETALYGIDIGTSYPELLKMVLEVDPSFEVHVAQFNPFGVIKYYNDLLPLFSNSRVTDIQIPIQSSSERILKLMRRHSLDVKKIGKFIQMVRKNNKTAVLRTDLIVGFPTETEEELNESLRFVVDTFDEIAVYAIEIRKGLPIEKLKDRAYSSEEIDRRINFAVKFVEDKGKMAHKGQQGEDLSLHDVEMRKEALRKAKRELARKCD